jgi:hypothetical protein
MEFSDESQSAPAPRPAPARVVPTSRTRAYRVPTESDTAPLLGLL